MQLDENQKFLSKLEMLYLIINSVMLYLTLPLLIKYKTLSEFLDNVTTNKTRQINFVQIKRNIEMIEKILRFLKRKLKINKNYCFRKSVVLFCFLQRCNIRSNINIGLKLDKKEMISGHCWLDLRGKTHFEKDDDYQHYNVLLGQNKNISYWMCA